MKDIEKMIEKIERFAEIIKTHKPVVFDFDKEELLNDEDFKKDPITQQIDDFNDQIGFCKVRGIVLEVLPEYQETEQLIDLNGYLIRHHTLAKLIRKGVVKVIQIGV